MNPPSSKESKILRDRTSSTHSYGKISKCTCVTILRPRERIRRYANSLMFHVLKDRIHVCDCWNHFQSPHPCIRCLMEEEGVCCMPCYLILTCFNSPPPPLFLLLYCLLEIVSTCLLIFEISCFFKTTHTVLFRRKIKKKDWDRYS